MIPFQHHNDIQTLKQSFISKEIITNQIPNYVSTRAHVPTCLTCWVVTSSVWYPEHRGSRRMVSDMGYTLYPEPWYRVQGSRSMVSDMGYTLYPEPWYRVQGTG